MMTSRFPSSIFGKDKNDMKSLGGSEWPQPLANHLVKKIYIATPNALILMSFLLIQTHFNFMFAVFISAHSQHMLITWRDAFQFINISG